MGGQVTGTPERLSPWPGHRALAATCLLSARVPGLTGGGMGPRWAGLEDRVRARSWGARAGKLFRTSAAAARVPLGRARSPAAGAWLRRSPRPAAASRRAGGEARRRGLGPAGDQGKARPGLGRGRGAAARPRRRGLFTRAAVTAAAAAAAARAPPPPDRKSVV